MFRFVTVYYMLFYKLYTWGKRIHREKNGPEYNAVLGVAFLTAMNIFSIPGLVEVFFRKRILVEIDSIPNWVIWSFMIFLILINYLLFVNKSKYELIAKKFEKKDRSFHIRSTIFVTLYIIVSLLALLGPWIVLAERYS